MQLTNHCLHPLLPPDKTLSHMLRPWRHAFQLPTCVYIIYIRNHFVISCLFKFLAWLCFTCLIFIYYIAVLPLSILYFDIYVCYMFNKITYLLTYLLTYNIVCGLRCSHWGARLLCPPCVRPWYGRNVLSWAAILRAIGWRYLNFLPGRVKVMTTTFSALLLQTTLRLTVH